MSNESEREQAETKLVIERLAYEISQLKLEIHAVKELAQDSRDKQGSIQKAVAESRTAAKQANNTDGLVWLGIVITLLLAMTSNPTVEDHIAVISNKEGLDVNSNQIMRIRNEWFSSNLFFSTVSLEVELNGEPHSEMLTLGIFNHVFEQDALDMLAD